MINDYNLTKLANILLWDKYQNIDRYGVINDDRMWHSIGMIDLYTY